VNRTSEEERSWVRPDEAAIVRRLGDLVSQVLAGRRWYVTDFLSPREQLLLTSIGKQNGAPVEFYGGYPGAERNRSIIMPDNWFPAKSDYQVQRLKLETDAPITHGSVLGSLLGLGIERRVVGDIVFAKDGIYIFTSATIARFVEDMLVQVGKTPVHVKQDHSGSEIQPIMQNLVEKSIFVSSLRADAVIAQSCGLSRNLAQEHITRGLVTLNFTPLVKVDSQLFSSDILSIRHFGRVKVKEIGSTTKKDRTRVIVEILKSSS
jgi:RNA-binding protein YlmH